MTWCIPRGPPGEELLEEALRLLAKVTDFDCSSLVEGCEQMVEIARTNKAKA